MMRRMCLRRAFAKETIIQKVAQTAKNYSASRLEDEYLKSWQTKLQAQCQDNLKDFTFSCKSNTIMQYMRSEGGQAEIERETKEFEKLIILSWVEQLFDRDELSIKLAQRMKEVLEARKFVCWPVLNRVALAQIMAYLKLKHPGWHDQMASHWPVEIERITMLDASHAEMYYFHSALKGVPGVRAELLTTEISKWYQIPISFQITGPSEESGTEKQPKALFLFKGVVRSKLNVDQPIHLVTFSKSQEALAKQDFISNLNYYNNLRLISDFSKKTGGRALLVSAVEGKTPNGDVSAAKSHNPLSVWRPLAQQIVDLAKR